MIRECLWKKTQTEKKNSWNQNRLKLIQNPAWINKSNNQLKAKPNCMLKKQHKTKQINSPTHLYKTLKLQNMNY